MGSVVFDRAVYVLFLAILALNCFTEFGTDAQAPLAQNEVKALEAISTKLKNLNWSINENFCSNVGSINFRNDEYILRNITCKCNNTCSIISIELKGLNISGVLPPEFGDLTNLQQLDLTRNYISGQIPTSFARLPLVNLSLLGNQLNGSIPTEIGDIGSLEGLVLEANQLGGPLPESLGNLSKLKRL